MLVTKENQDILTQNGFEITDDTQHIFIAKKEIQTAVGDKSFSVVAYKYNSNVFYPTYVSDGRNILEGYPFTNKEIELGLKRCQKRIDESFAVKLYKQKLRMTMAMFKLK